MTNSTLQTTIRRAHPDDAGLLADFGARTFVETFGHLYSHADLQSFLHASHSVESWERTLADPGRAVWLAMHDDEAAGFIAAGVCKLPVENLEARAGEIHMLYVLRQYQNLRLGAQLMDTGLDWLAAQGKAPLYIGVWSENYGAQRFYARYGFSKVGEYGFRVGETVDREFILKR